MENTVDLAGKDESEIRRVTKEIIIGLWPLLGAGFQADEAQVARLKEWLDEVRTWNVDRSGR